MKVLNTSKNDIQKAATALIDGLLVAIPTETVYGLGVNALNSKSVARVFAVKRRPYFDPLIVHIYKFDQILEFANTELEYVESIASNFWPGPLTIILPKITSKIPEIVSSGLDTIAFRCPSHPVATSILKQANIPIAAPSANTFGYLSPTTAEHVIEGLGQDIDYVIDAGPCSVGIESTVLDLSATIHGKPPCILRHGAISMEAIKTIIPCITSSTDVVAQPKAPGQLSSHYAPACPLYLTKQGGLRDIQPQKKAAALCFGRAEADLLTKSGLWNIIIDLSPDENTVEAASNLFESLHILDNSPVDELWAALLPDEGIGRAINDRLYRASAK